MPAVILTICCIRRPMAPACSRMKPNGSGLQKVSTFRRALAEIHRLRRYQNAHPDGGAIMAATAPPSTPGGDVGRVMALSRYLIFLNGLVSFKA